MNNDAFLNFAQAAQQVLGHATQVTLGWVSSHPAPAALYGIAAAFLVIGARDLYKKHLAERQRSEAFKASLPKIEPLKLPPLDGFKPR